MALQLWPFAEIHNNFHKIHLLCFPHVMLHVLHRKFIFQDEIQKRSVPNHAPKMFLQHKTVYKNNNNNKNPTRFLPSGFEIKARASHEESIPNQPSYHFYFLKNCLTFLHL